MRIEDAKAIVENILGHWKDHPPSNIHEATAFAQEVNLAFKVLMQQNFYIDDPVMGVQGGVSVEQDAKGEWFLVPAYVR